MRFDILTIFPDMFEAYISTGVLGRAVENGLVEIGITNIRDFAFDRHRTTDDRPYGGGDGMVMKAGPIHRALNSLESTEGRREVVLLSPRGKRFDQEAAWDLARFDHLVFICGRYEGVDERIRLSCADREISIGDFILSGGELGALVIVDAVSRLIPGVLGGERSNREDSFEEGLLEYPQYTRPKDFMGMEVPEVLLSGDHERIRKWRRRKALEKTLQDRPDMLSKARLTGEDEVILVDLKKES